MFDADGVETDIQLLGHQVGQCSADTLAHFGARAR